MDINFMLPFQGAHWMVAFNTQGDAIGLEYAGLSARKHALKGQYNLAQRQRPGGNGKWEMGMNYN